MTEFSLTASETSETTAAVLEAAKVSDNEEQLKIKTEGLLEGLCRKHGIFWNSYTYEHSFDSGRNGRYGQVFPKGSITY